MKCAFCEIPAIREREVVRNDLAWAFPTNIPIVPGHLLILPIRHVATVDELTTEELQAIFDLRAQLKVALTKAFMAEGFNYAWNEGKLAGQSVPHVHFHIVPRKEADAGIVEYEPRKFLYRPGGREDSPEAELRAVALTIKKHLK
jgi:histidine triad (HIT) family protein